MSAVSTTCWINFDDSLLAEYINKQIVLEERPSETDAHRIGTICLAILGVCGGYAASNIFIKTALAYPKRTISIFSAVGCCLGFGSFFADGWLRVVERTQRPLHQEELLLRKHYQSTAALVSVCTASLFFGIFAQFGLIEACEENYEEYAMAIGIATMVGASGPLINSVYDSIDFLMNMIKSGVIKCQFKDRSLQTLYAVKQKMIGNFKENVSYALTLPLEERRLQFKAFYNQQTTSLNTERMTDLYATTRDLFVLKEGCKNRIQERSVCHVTAKYLIYTVLIALSSGFFIEQGILGYGSSHDVTSNATWMVIFTILSLAPWVWKGVTVPGQSMYGIFNQVTGMFGFGQRTTFVEQFHPKLSKLVDLLVILTTFLTYPQIVTLAEECCFDASTTRGNVLLFGSLVTIMSYFFCSMKTLIEKGIVAADKHGCDMNIRDLVALKEKTDEALRLLEKLDIPDLEAFLRANSADERLIMSILDS